MRHGGATAARGVLLAARRAERAAVERAPVRRAGARAAHERTALGTGYYLIILHEIY